MVETIISLYNKINILLSNKRCEFEFYLHQNQFFDVCNKIKTSNPIISIKKKIFSNRWEKKSHSKSDLTLVYIH